MNASLFVGLCEDAGLNVEFRSGITYVYGDLNECLADEYSVELLLELIHRKKEWQLQVDDEQLHVPPLK